MFILIKMLFYWTFNHFFRALAKADSTYVKVNVEYKITKNIVRDKTKSSEEDDWGNPKKLNMIRGRAKSNKMWLR